MKSLISIFLFVGIVTLYIGCSDNNPSAPALSQDDQVTNTLDKKPAANLIGVMELTFVGSGGVSWEGTIDFEGYPQYQIYFHGSAESEERGKSYHFVESFEIMDGSVLLLAVSDEGIEPGNLKSETPMYMSNGVVTEANPPFAEWLGRKTHMSGIVTLDTNPWTAPGILRIN